MKKEEVYEILNQAYFSEDCHEKELLENLPRLLRRTRLFVDVGASLGQYTKLASHCMREGRIVAIEADPIRYEELVRNAGIWSRETGAVIEPLFAAVGSEAGETTFYTTNSNVSGGLFPHAVKTQVEWSEIRVPSVTLDRLFSDAMPDFVKADIEGAEMRMLKGAKRILERGLTVFLMEIHPWADPVAGTREDITEFMRGYGYRRVAFFKHVLFLPFGMVYLREKLTAGARKYLR
ncbi:MAG: FkbM family methyltransferase [Gammaproteobacteria bacterium]|nr:FkbM family methyltransferase [Gammaproteobacteria bacterium]